MRRKPLLWIIVVAFILLYLAVAVQLYGRTGTITEVGMQYNSDYAGYMSESVYKRLNPVESGATKDTAYLPENHHQGLVLPLHFFFIAKVWTSHRYQSGTYGFEEPVAYTMRLNDWKWKAVKVKIAP